MGRVYFTPFLMCFSQTDAHLWMSSLGTDYSYGSHFFMQRQSGSQFSCCVQGLNILKQGDASVPLPTVHCQPPLFCMALKSTNLLAKYLSPSCQSRKRSLAKKEAVIMRHRLCMNPVVFSSLIAASTIGKPVLPAFHAQRCSLLYFHFTLSNLGWKELSFLLRTLGK